MPSPYYGFLWRENEEAMFWSFHPLADKTINEHLHLYRNHFSRSDENLSNSIEKAYRTYPSTYINEIDTLQTDLEASWVSKKSKNKQDFVQITSVGS